MTITHSELQGIAFENNGAGYCIVEGEGRNGVGTVVAAYAWVDRTRAHCQNQSIVGVGPGFMFDGHVWDSQQCDGCGQQVSAFSVEKIIELDDFESVEELETLLEAMLAEAREEKADDDAYVDARRTKQCQEDLDELLAQIESDGLKISGSRIVDADGDDMRLVGDGTDEGAVIEGQWLMVWRFGTGDEIVSVSADISQWRIAA